MNLLRKVHSVGIRLASVVNMASGDMKPKVVFVLGGPGAGKGTICAQICEKYHFQHLSAGDLLREERNKPGTEFGELIETHIKNGTIVPVEITCKLIERAMSASATDKFLIDGFPRNKDNLQGWETEMSNKVELLFVLFLKCSEDVCIQRCLSRGAAGSGRSDDNSESLKKRIQTYTKETMPIVEHYMKLGLVKTFDGDQTKEEVFSAVSQTFDAI